MQAGEDKCTGCERVLYDFEVIRVGVDKLCHVCAAMEAERCRAAIAYAHAAGYAEAKAEIARGLRSLADGFHFASDLPAEKTLRNWINVSLAPADHKILADDKLMPCECRSHTHHCHRYLHRAKACSHPECCDHATDHLFAHSDADWLLACGKEVIGPHGSSWGCTRPPSHAGPCEAKHMKGIYIK